MKIKLKELMKNKLFVGGTTIALALIVGITAILLLPDKKPNETQNEEPKSSQTATVPEIEKPSQEPEASSETATQEVPSDLVVDIGNDNSKQNNAEKDKENVAEQPEKEIIETPPEQEKQPENGGGIHVGDGGVKEKYSCGSPNHHCESAQAHAWLQNQENEGCEYCGSHSCPSFYVLNEWGFTDGDSKQCPKYSDKKDPIKYCQRCGKKNGNGDNDTCQKWIKDFACPKCGEIVKANTCH
ncbi:MAG: hypothetical protein RRZ68_03190, partial [Oscillospiraceae bacterium]